MSFTMKHTINPIRVGKIKETAVQKLNRPLSSRQVKKEKLRHEGLVPVSKGSQAL